MNKEYFEIIGGNKLFGKIKNQTSKNATLPIMSASLLCDGVVKINDVPEITDVKNMIKILLKLGVEVGKKQKTIKINASKANNSQIDSELAKTMRSSLFLLGPMLSKFKEVDLTLPGGCKIGKRPIDIHIKAFKQLGVEVIEHGDRVHFKVKKAKPTRIKLRIPSVGATENIIQFACKLKGKTVILNAAKEPEVVDLCNFLNQMGAKILGVGTNKITIYGVETLRNTKYKPIGDRIAAGTIMIAVALCGGSVSISNAVPYQNLKLIKILTKLGCQIYYKNDIIKITRDGDLKSINRISTGFYPKFPTDLQSLMLTLTCVANGKTIIKENVFENRFLTVNQLKKMGALINVNNPQKVKIMGNKELNGCDVEAQDLRGGAALVLAGLVANGTTTVRNINFIDRGYESFETLLTSLGAQIRRLWQKKVI